MGSPWAAASGAASFTPRARAVGAEEVVPLHPDVVSALAAVRAAIAVGVHPDRVSQGSSGSYFVHNEGGETLAIFKPKDEEPYGERNPKWMKWLHKTFAPCCFGRACLIANQGFLSEAAAFVVDQALGLDIVPPTNLVALASPAFNYGTASGERAPLRLAPKLGSFQLFVAGYVDAQTFLDTHAAQLADPASPLARSFFAQFERLVVLDYIIRNTDRGTDNWLVRVDWDDAGLPTVRIAAIDNGLAFPFKHPNGCRTYPYAWNALPQTHLPFSDALADTLLPRLTLEAEWDDMAAALRDVFELDEGFDDESFAAQMAVMRGQAYNVFHALDARATPADLIDAPCRIVTPSPLSAQWSDPVLADAGACFNTW